LIFKVSEAFKKADHDIQYFIDDMNAFNANPYVRGVGGLRPDMKKVRGRKFADL
jgi:hypothetical protein